MDKKMVAIILRGYIRLLDFSIDEIEEKLPEELAIKVKQPLLGEYTDYPILRRLYGLRRMIQDDIHFLTGENFNDN